jgi:hypothetical protein
LLIAVDVVMVVIDEVGGGMELVGRVTAGGGVDDKDLIREDDEEGGGRLDEVDGGLLDEVGGGTLDVGGLCVDVIDLVVLVVFVEVDSSGGLRQLYIVSTGTSSVYV